MKEKIIEILRDQISIKSTKSLYQLAAELESLFQQEYLNSCIEKATPALSKIKDVDKELAEIRGELQTCKNCKHKDLNGIQYPCRDCNPSFDKYEADTNELAEKNVNTDYMDTEQTCANCRYDMPVLCYKCDDYDKWEPIKTE